jgi:hypothetical protein
MPKITAQDKVEDFLTTMSTNLKRIRPVPLNSPHTLNFVTKKKESKRIDEMNKKMLLKL